MIDLINTFNICKKCKLSKSLNKFRKISTYGVLGTGIGNVCFDCKNKKRRELYKENPDKYKISATKWRLNNKEKTLEAARKWWRLNHKEYNAKYYSSLDQSLKRILRNSKKNANKKRINFSLDLNDLSVLWQSQQGLCAVTKIPLEIQKGLGKNKRGLSLDRINSMLGYEKTNIRFVCYAVNFMKNNMTDKELLIWCEYITKGLLKNAI
jgi:hypothetical protein